MEPHERRAISITLLPKHNAGQDAYRGFALEVFSRCQSESLANCLVAAQVVNARFELTPQVVDLKNAYIGTKHNIKLQLRNIGQVVGRWLFPPQELNDACIITADQQTGVLASGVTQQITCILIPRGLGNIVVPITFISDVGDQECM